MSTLDRQKAQTIAIIPIKFNNTSKNSGTSGQGISLNCFLAQKKEKNRKERKK
jgi:hypothetical protein